MDCDPDEALIYQEFGIQVENEDYDPEQDFAPLVHFLTKWKFVMQSIEDAAVPAVLMEPMNDITTEEWDEFVGSLQEMSFEDMQNMTRELVADEFF